MISIIYAALWKHPDDIARLEGLLNRYERRLVHRSHFDAAESHFPRVAHAGTLAAARADGAIAVVNASPPNAIDADLVAQFDIAVVNETELGVFEGSLPPRVVAWREG